MEGVVEPEVVIILSNLRLRGIRDRRSRGFEELEGSDLLSKGDNLTSKGRIVSVGVDRGGYSNRGEAGLNLNFFFYLIL